MTSRDLIDCCARSGHPLSIEQDAIVSGFMAGMKQQQRAALESYTEAFCLFAVEPTDINETRATTAYVKLHRLLTR